jgi:methyl-accepting chemotaxis protein
MSIDLLVGFSIVSVASCLFGLWMGQTALFTRFARAANQPLGEDVQQLLQSIDDFSVQVTPVWSGQIDLSRQEMERAVQSLMTHFSSINQHIEVILSASIHAFDQGQHDTLSHCVEQLQDLAQDLERTFALGLQLQGRFLEQLQQLSGTDVAEADPQSGLSLLISSLQHSIQTEMQASLRILQNLQATVGNLQRCRADLHFGAQTLDGAVHKISSEIEQSMVHFQFQDRVGQILHHVRDSIADFAPHWLASEGASISRSAVRPLAVDQLLRTLESSYTMESEGQVHLQSPQTQQNSVSEITFF